MKNMTLIFLSTAALSLVSLHSHSSPENIKIRSDIALKRAQIKAERIANESHCKMYSTTIKSLISLPEALDETTIYSIQNDIIQDINNANLRSLVSRYLNLSKEQANLKLVNGEFLSQCMLTQS